MANLVGLKYLKINGIELDVKGNVGIHLGKDQLEEIVGSDKFHGFKVTPKAAMIELEITDSKELSLDWLSNLKDGTVVIGLRNGKLYSLSNACSTNPDGGKLETEEGKISVKFVGKKMSELL